MSDDDWTFELVLVNDSATAWNFVVFQHISDKPGDFATLAWLASPFRSARGSFVRFRWQLRYSFEWSGSASLRPGDHWSRGGSTPARLNDRNETTFSYSDRAPGFAAPTMGPQPQTLYIQAASDVPVESFAVGIGMSGIATSGTTAWPNRAFQFQPARGFFIAATEAEVQVGDVLDIESLTAVREMSYSNRPAYRTTATLDDRNQWSVIES